MIPSVDSTYVVELTVYQRGMVIDSQLIAALGVGDVSISKGIGD